MHNIYEAEGGGLRLCWGDIPHFRFAFVAGPFRLSLFYLYSCTIKDAYVNLALSLALPVSEKCFSRDHRSRYAVNMSWEH